MHRENTARRLRIDEIAVPDLNKCIVEFECDPFDSSSITLKTLQSGQVAPPGLQDDLLTAKSDGENEGMKEAFPARPYLYKKFGIRLGDAQRFPQKFQFFSF